MKTMREWLIKLLGGCVLNHKDYYDDDERKFYNSKETIEALKEALSREVMNNVELSTEIQLREKVSPVISWPMVEKEEHLLLTTEHELLKPGNQYCKHCGDAMFTKAALVRCTGVIKNEP